jgi:fructosamine-3-kinase
VRLGPSEHAALSDLLGCAVRRATPLSGGEVCAAFAIETADGQTVFAKHHPREPRGMFALEAAGLRALSSSGSVCTPEVVAVTAPGASSAWLALSLVEVAAPTPEAEARFGRGLTGLHRAPPPPVAAENWLGPFRQRNHPVPTSSTWPTFWWEHRLAPRIRSAQAAGALPVALVARFHKLQPRLPELLATTDPMSLLHGDLWSGNRLTSAEGQPFLIDPAVSVGHREVDLAMMDLFGGFGPACWQAYDAAWPLAPGHERRRAVYQLYYLLVHVELFGASYLRGLSDALHTAGV